MKGKKAEKKVRPMFAKREAPPKVEPPKFSFTFNTPTKEVIRVLANGELMLYSSKQDKMVPIKELESEADAGSAARFFYKVLSDLSSGGMKANGEAMVESPRKKKE